MAFVKFKIATSWKFVFSYFGCLSECLSVLNRVCIIQFSICTLSLSIRICLVFSVASVLFLLVIPGLSLTWIKHSGEMKNYQSYFVLFITCSCVFQITFASDTNIISCISRVQGELSNSEYSWVTRDFWYFFRKKMLKNKVR